MKKSLGLFSFFLVLIFSLCSLLSFSVFADSEPTPPEIKSEAAILIHYDSGRIIFEKNADEKHFPASTTKVMTALLALENLSLDTSLTASQEAVNIDRDGSNMGILAGETLTAEQLLYGLLVHSANDAANVLAEAVSGTIDEFVVLMNKKAEELGMENTQFRNPHGYHNDEHYTTAHDLALVCREAMKNEKFVQIVQTPTYEIPPTEKYTETRYLSSNNMLLNTLKGHKYIYDGAKGIKTGHTDAAGYCLTSFAERDGVSYICVTMAAPIDENDNYAFSDTISLFNYAFGNFKLKTVSNADDILSTAPVKWAKGGEQVILTAGEPLKVLLPASFNTNDLKTNLTVEEKIKAPVKKGDVLGSLEYFYNDELVGTTTLVASKDVKRGFFRMIIGGFFDIVFSAWVMIPFFLLVVALLCIRSYNLRKRRKLREQRRRQQREKF